MSSVEKQILIEQRVQNDGKSMIVAYLLLIFFGGLGLHRFYLGRIKSGLLMLLCYIGGFILLLSGLTGSLATGMNYAQTYGSATSTQTQEAAVAALTSGFSGAAMFGIVLLIVVGIWCFIDLFLVYGYVNKQHEQLRKNIAEQLK